MTTGPKTAKQSFSDDNDADSTDESWDDNNDVSEYDERWMAIANREKERSRIQRQMRARRELERRRDEKQLRRMVADWPFDE